MSTEVKSLILCNNPIAIPAIREFLFYGKVGAIVVTKRNKEMQQLIRSMTENHPVPLLIVTKPDYKARLTAAISEYGINVGLMMTFPFIIPEEIWSIPEKGFINFHFGYSCVDIWVCGFIFVAPLVAWLTQRGPCLDG